MQAVRVIDSDAHVFETDDTWNYMLPEEQSLKPTTGYPSNPDPNRPPTRYWLIDGHRRPRMIEDDATAGTRVEARELLDIDVRLRHMDELGVETHVIYPTLFLTEFAARAETELAWARSYNRWMADRCSRSHGRLRWVCVPPLRNLEEALKELQFAKDNGACGVVKKGDQEAERWPADPYFFPLYEQAQRLDMPICFHIGTGIPEWPSWEQFSYGRVMRTRYPALHGIHSLLVNDVPSKFPTLRFGCIEAGASWVPFVKYDVLRLAARRADSSRLTGLTYVATDDIIKANRIYVTCLVDEDLPYIISQIGEDNLLAGSDYSHQDQSKELNFVQQLYARADRGDISTDTVRKILYDNPKAFYGL